LRTGLGIFLLLLTLTTWCK